MKPKVFLLKLTGKDILIDPHFVGLFRFLSNHKNVDLRLKRAPERDR